MTNPVFHRKDGSLTRYALACGYIQRKENNGQYKELWMEHGHIHVKSGVIGVGYSVWECFDSELTKAKKFYNKIKI